MIAIVDYGMGNRRSVEKALEHVGARPVLTADADTILAAEGVVVPGVGAFPEAMRRLRAAGLEDVGDASVYGTLRRLFQGGFLTTYVVPSEEGPHRKYYSLNDPGRLRLAESGKTWQSFASTMNVLLGEAA